MRGVTLEKKKVTSVKHKPASGIAMPAERANQCFFGNKTVPVRPWSYNYSSMGTPVRLCGLSNSTIASGTV